MSTRNMLAAFAAVGLFLSVIFPLPATANDENADVGFSPGYASGPDYDAFVATLPGLGLLSDGDGDGQLNDERCSSNGEATLAEVGASLNLLVAAGTLCNALPVDDGQEICYGVLAVIATTLQANATVIAQCKLQDGAVDVAEIEAAFENTKHILAARLEEDLLQCNRLLSLRYPTTLNGRADEVRDLVDLRIQQMQSAGQDPGNVARAQANFAIGVIALNAGQHQDAYRNFCLAYLALSTAT